MKRIVINRLFAAMFLTVAVVSCSKESQPLSPAPEPVVEEIKPVAKVINYSVSVKNGSSSTKAIIDPDDPNQRRQVFATGDQLKISGTDITGTLNLQSGAGTQSAQFVGTLQYTGSGDEPAPSLALSAILTNANDKRINNGYSNAISSSLSEAVEQFSNLTATSTYGERTFNLTQGSTFINFDLIAYGLDGSCTVTITDDNSYSLSGTVTVSDEKAVFTASFAGGTTLVNPIVTITSGTKVIKRPFGSASTSLGTNKASKVTDKAPQIGDIYYSDGTWSRNRQTSGAQALGRIVYVNEGSSSLAPSGVTDAAQFADGVTEKVNGFGHALVIANKDCPLTTNGIRWSQNNYHIRTSDSPAYEQGWFTASSLPDSEAEALRNQLMLSSFDAIGKTDFMINNDNYKKYFAGAKIRNYTPAPASHVVASAWFMPTISQWIASFIGLGGAPASEQFLFPIDGNYYHSASIYENFYSYSGSGEDDFKMPLNLADKSEYDNLDGNKNYNMNFYWSSTQTAYDRVLCIGFINSTEHIGVALAHHVKNRTREAQDGLAAADGRSARAFLAF